MNPDTPTPRTDREAIYRFDTTDRSGLLRSTYIIEDSGMFVVPANFARTLERELAEANETITGLRGLDKQNESIIAKLQSELAALRRDAARLAKAAEEVLRSFIISKKVEGGHPCPESMVICSELRAAIDAAIAQEDKK